MSAAGRRRTAAPPTRSGPEGSSRNGLRTGRRPVCTFSKALNGSWRATSAVAASCLLVTMRNTFGARTGESAMGLVRVALAMAVLLGHLPVASFKFMGGGLAVQSFFIVSGFYMALVLSGKYRDVGLFYSNRLL